MQLQQQQSTLDELNATVVVVTFELNVVAENYIRQTKLPWAFLVDTDRELYRGYGMEHGKWWDLAGPSAILVYFKLFFRGRTLKRTTGDVKQLGGDVVVDPDGIVRFHHVGKGPADRPSVETLLQVIRD